MPLHPGARLGPYEVLSALGAGGMGEVWRARDSRLGRDVALKVLPEEFVADPERLARFEREAKVLASLNHPHIGGIHGLEEADGVKALVLELVEGPTLADRIARGPIPIDEALPIARQVAEALEAAHEKGIVHRDLKPANVKVRSDGTVKVLDFGLAKALEPQLAVAEGDLSHSPTLPLVAATQMGVILGTAAYMAPEQARGRPVDKRADIWAFGCVLYEMLSGRQPFSGENVADTLVSVMTKEPEWSAVPAVVGARIVELSRRCLAKDPRDRLRDIGDARFDLEMAGAAPVEAERNARPAGRSVVASRRILPWAVAFVFGLLAVVTATTRFRESSKISQPSAPAHFTIELPPGVTLPLDPEQSVLALSPDGKELVFVGETSAKRQLYLRSLADPVARPIDGTENATAPFFSPDGAWITFVRDSMITKVAVTGGAPLALHAATPATVNRGATWITNDDLVYAASANSGLSRGAVSSDQPPGFDGWAYATSEINAPYAWPWALPGGRHVLFSNMIGDTPDRAHVCVLTLASRMVTTVATGGTAARYSASGHLLFARGGGLFAVPFDADQAAASGAELEIVESVIVAPSGIAQYAVSSSGTLAYVAGPRLTRQHELVWVDRSAHAAVLWDDGREYSFPRLSPDGGRLAVTSSEGANYDVWVLDLRRASLERVTTDPGEDFGPLWHPDGVRLAMSSEAGEEEGPGLAWTTGPDRRLEFPFTTPGIGNWEFPTSWSPNGEYIAFTRDRQIAASDIEMLPTAGGASPLPFATDAASEFGAMFNPRHPSNPYVAYVSDVSGRDEVYVRSFPGPGPATMISTNGGFEPQWSRDGAELFYREGDALKAVRFGNGSALEQSITAPTTVFEGKYARAPYGGRSANYDVSLDGQRFLFVRRKNLPQPTTIHVVLDWPQALLGTRTDR